MIKFLYSGRLEAEKGVGLIIDTFSTLYERGIRDRHIDIYGTGSYERYCKHFAEYYPHNVAHHGRTPQEIIFKKIEEVDIALMPSFVVETFGLTALEALAHGAPVIGFQKAGTAPFIFDELNISAYEWKSDVGKLTALVTKLMQNGFSKEAYREKINSLVENYSREQRLENFTRIAAGAKRILMVSDFISQIGGVESYLHNTKKLLETQGYTVQLFGSQKKNTFGGLFITVLNIGARRRLRKKIKIFQPDLIRTHSVIRHLGRLPLTAIPRNVRSITMLHDMGYFYPYPARLSSLQQLPQNNSLLSRIRSAQSNNLLTRCLLTLKRLSLWVVKKMFARKVDTYLVPSPFMKPMVESWGDKDKEVMILWHSVK